ncbi:hypothetical protein P7C70_g6350, partial [Phenoliferia sp. Uapishka_3]
MNASISSASESAAAAMLIESTTGWHGKSEGMLDPTAQAMRHTLRPEPLRKLLHSSFEGLLPFYRALEGVSGGVFITYFFRPVAQSQARFYSSSALQLQPELIQIHALLDQLAVRMKKEWAAEAKAAAEEKEGDGGVAPVTPGKEDLRKERDAMALELAALRLQLVTSAPDVRVPAVAPALGEDEEELGLAAAEPKNKAKKSRVRFHASTISEGGAEGRTIGTRASGRTKAA